LTPSSLKKTDPHFKTRTVQPKDLFQDTAVNAGVLDFQILNQDEESQLFTFL
jgi:hypothetical protein